MRINFKIIAGGFIFVSLISASTFWWLNKTKYDPIAQMSAEGEIICTDTNMVNKAPTNLHKRPGIYNSLEIATLNQLGCDYAFQYQSLRTAIFKDPSFQVDYIKQHAAYQELTKSYLKLHYAILQYHFDPKTDNYFKEYLQASATSILRGIKIGDPTAVELFMRYLFETTQISKLEREKYTQMYQEEFSGELKGLLAYLPINQISLNVVYNMIQYKEENHPSLMPLKLKSFAADNFKIQYFCGQTHDLAFKKISREIGLNQSTFNECVEFFKNNDIPSNATAIINKIKPILSPDESDWFDLIASKI